MYVCMYVWFRFGTLLGKRGSRVLVLLSIEVQIVVCLFMMSITLNRSILSPIGTTSFLSRFLCFSFLFSNLAFDLVFLEDCCYVCDSIVCECCFSFHQASPRDPKAFPFILLGNKVDIDGGNTRVVSKLFRIENSIKKPERFRKSSQVFVSITQNQCAMSGLVYIIYILLKVLSHFRCVVHTIYSW